MSNGFVNRHIGPGKDDVQRMLNDIGAASIEQLIGDTIPENIRLKKPLQLPEGLSEQEYLNEIREKAKKNKVFKSYIGLGYYGCFVPPVIQRNLLENPGWYTAYTPYQSEISQGRLEGLLNFQTMVMDLTGMEIANASLLDEATAAAEAMSMFLNMRSRSAVQRNACKFFVSKSVFPQTIDVLKTRAESLGIELLVGDHMDFTFDNEVFGAIVQYPAEDGNIHDYREFVEKAHAVEAKVVVAADLLGLALLTPPGEWNADAVVGSAQRFGVPMGYGGPHAAFFTTREEYKRHVPGRIIGVSVDKHGKKALRMALQTREQHIKRARATSNICTAQALLAVMSAMYAVYHGPDGIRNIADEVHQKATGLAASLQNLGFAQLNKHYFDTLKIGLPENTSTQKIQEKALRKGVNFRYDGGKHVLISIDETTTDRDILDIIGIFSTSPDKENKKKRMETSIPEKLKRTTPFLTHPVFNAYHSETEMMRYLKRLENKDISLTHSMISLGSCTMKLNAASELLPVSLPEFTDLHPFAPLEQAEGYAEIIRELHDWLCEITGFDALSFQPNSGAQGEYAGLMVIREYHRSRGEASRNVALIPESAHGTNPASAVMAGMKVVVVKCDSIGNINIPDLKEKAEKYKESLSALMVTYPSTHGVFEEGIVEINNIIHDNGGQVYLDGANMNAQVGLTNPAVVGADVCHLNLHKTFAIPHGGGGPGMGPIGVKEHLIRFLPGHPLIKTGGESSISAIAAAPWGSALILLISYGYLKMLGKSGLTRASEIAILNANYLKAKLEEHYPILYKGVKGNVAHEMIVDCRDFKRSAKIEVEDVAKRLIDYGFHAPTVSFPVAGTLMIEPTESESKAELDRFVEAMIAIRKEVREIEEGRGDEQDNVLKNAPHTADAIIDPNFNHPYSREKAVFPLNWVKERKYWPVVGRIENAYGDRQLICSCPPLESFQEEITAS